MRVCLPEALNSSCVTGSTVALRRFAEGLLPFTIEHVKKNLHLTIIIHGNVYLTVYISILNVNLNTTKNNALYHVI